jgi:tetratricopeptide (TPR) repeat protein
MDGESIGPLPLRALEVLFDGRIIDEGTPVSEDGVMFRALRDFPMMLDRMMEVKEALQQGQDPWAAPVPQPSGQAKRPARGAATIESLEAAKPLKAMLNAALEKQTGRLALRSEEGDLEVLYKEGKIVALETSIEVFRLEHYLLASGVADDKAMRKAEERAPQMGGDIGGALISLGLVQPHTYFEKFIGWAKATLGKVVTHTFMEAAFERADVANPPVPLGFDRLGILMDLVREAADKSFLEGKLLLKRPCPLILSQVEGAKVDEMKLKASELRVMNAINGAKTLGEIIDSFGGSDQKALETLGVIYFAEQAGFTVFGEDPQLGKEVQEAIRLREHLEKVKKKNHLEVLGVTEKASDEEVKTKYNEFAKIYHPDKLRGGAAPELIDVRREIFALITDSYNAIGVEAQRFQYANDLAQGRTGSEEDLQKVQAVLHAETLFKKAEILARVKKWDEAVAHIDEALSLKPDDIEFKIFRVFYAYRLSQKTAITDPTSAIKAILTLMKSDANIASGYMFLAHLHKEAGKPETATKYFEKVLEFDERNPEATREVRLAAMRADKSKSKKKWF